MKTDARDALRIAKPLRLGENVAVAIPSELAFSRAGPGSTPRRVGLIE